MKVLCLLFSSLFFLSSFAFGEEVKLGYIDFKKAIENTSAGKAAKLNLEEKFNKKKKELEKTEENLKKLNDELVKKKSVLSEAVLNRKQSEFQQKMMEYREVVGKSQMEIQKEERDLMVPIIDKLKKSVDKIAKEQKYSMILEKAEQSVVWALPSLDITDQAVKEYEKMKDEKTSEKPK